MIFGYARVSTKDQNLARQEDALEKEVDRYFCDKATGKNMDREEFKIMLGQLRPGDTLKIVSIDRLGRSVRQLVNTAYQLEEMGVNIVSIKEGIDTSTPMGKIFYTLIAVFAELELSSIHERQRAGIEAAKNAGRFNGRPPKKLNYNLEKIIEGVEAGRFTVEQACKLLGVSRSTYYSRKAKMEVMPVMPEKDDNQSDNEVLDFGLSEDNGKVV